MKKFSSYTKYIIFNTAILKPVGKFNPSFNNTKKIAEKMGDRFIVVTVEFDGENNVLRTNPEYCKKYL